MPARSSASPGLLGSGRTELALALFGMLPVDSGRVTMDGKAVGSNRSRMPSRHGIGYVPEDRLSEGLFLEQSIGRNIVVRTIDRLRGRLGLTDPGRVAGQVNEWVELAAHQDRRSRAAGQDAVGRQPATGGAGQVAGQQRRA